ncbi:MAG: hypothetical protein M1830_006151 [Pleopsidium flavum]|nr:MAG: hypothetical protein M1830_006151 [Pleopsidium flavum]
MSELERKVLRWTREQCNAAYPWVLKEIPDAPVAADHWNANVHMSAIETIDECLDTEEYDSENTPDRYDAECIKLEMEDKERIPPEAS